MNRRFVNLLVNKLRAPRPAINLHRIDPGSLFYSPGSPKPADPAEIRESATAPGRLPSATISFDWPCKRRRTGWMDFMAFKNKIIAVDHEGRTVLYDSDSRAVLATNPMLPALQSNSMFVTVGDSLYAMATEAGAGLPSRLVWFYALICGKPPDLLGQDDWHWRSLKLPPFYYTNGDNYFSDDADYCSDDADDTSDDKLPHSCDMSAFTVVGDSQIWVSTVGAGTYSFDTVSCKWSKVGEWTLPFSGRAVYVADHNLWFGFSGEGYQLCAVDLALAQPVQHTVWEDPPPPEMGSLTLTATHLLPLGSGKLCVARLFQATDKEDGTLAVVTGVEVRRCAGIGNLQIIKHKSRHYSFGEDDEVRLL